MAGVRALLDQLATTVRAVVVLSDFDVQVEPRMVLNPSPPTVDMYPGDPFRDPQTAGFDDLDGAYVLTVRARVHTADDDAGQDLLLAFMDDENALSIQVALEDDQTLNGLATQVVAADNTGYRIYQDVSGAGAWLGCEWRVLLIRAES